MTPPIETESLGTGDGICSVCNKTHPWPNGSMPRHPFSGIMSFKKRPDGTTSGVPVEDAPASIVPAPGTPMTMPFDPVLRQALIDAGIITPEQLDAAQRKIAAITNTFSQRVAGT